MGKKEKSYFLIHMKEQEYTDKQTSHLMVPLKIWKGTVVLGSAEQTVPHKALLLWCELQILIMLSVLSPAFSAACISRTQKYLYSIHFCHTFHPTESRSASQTETSSTWGWLHPALKCSSSGAARGSAPDIVCDITLCHREWHQAVCSGNTGTPAQMSLLRLTSGASTLGKGLGSTAALTCSGPA